jgi:hypothetical protein
MLRELGRRDGMIEVEMCHEDGACEACRQVWSTLYAYNFSFFESACSSYASAYLSPFISYTRASSGLLPARSSMCSLAVSI